MSVREGALTANSSDQDHRPVAAVQRNREDRNKWSSGLILVAK